MEHRKTGLSLLFHSPESAVFGIQKIIPYISIGQSARLYFSIKGKSVSNDAEKFGRDQ